MKAGTGHFERIPFKNRGPSDPKWRTQHAYYPEHGGVTCEMAKATLTDLERALEGGIYIQAMKPATGADWCEYYGIDPETSNLRVPNIDAAILAQMEAGKLRLDMGGWHGDEDVDETNWCKTTHCRAGAAVCLAGKAGFDLERKLGDAETAGRMIYAVSDPTRPPPDFYASNEAALRDLRERAGFEKAPAA